MDLHAWAERLGRIQALDRVGEPAAGAVKRLTADRRVKDLLSGTWLGHPLHPLLTDIPIGSFTSATVLDLVGGRRGRRAADTLVAFGLLSSLPTAAAGAADWSDTFGDDQRLGVVHAAANTVGLAFYALSLAARVRGRRARGAALGLAGMGAMTAGGYLGGHLSYTRGVGVNHAFLEQPPRDWTPVLADADLPDGKSVRVVAGDAGVLLRRDGGTVMAIGSTCTHAGGPLHDGEVDAERCTVTCPWHQSVFRLDDGSVVHGPATVPQPAYDTRVENGHIEVRLRT